MRHSRHLLASAPIAIAAMASLHATAGLAQEAPVIVLEDPALVATPATSPVPVMAEPAPSIVLPEIEPVEPVVEPDSSAPAASTAPGSAPAAPLPAATSRSEAGPATPAATAATSASAEAVPTLAEEPLPTAAVEETARPVVTAPAPIPEPIRDGSTAALLFALLAAGGIGLAAVLLMRNRRRGSVPQIERPVVAAPLPLDREPEVTPLDEAPLRDTPVEPSRPLPTDGAAVPLPAELPANPGERRRLLQRMIAARPDRANPFHSYRARAKRARLILQSIGTHFTNRKPTIDLSQYTNVWPELRGWRPATA